MSHHDPRHSVGHWTTTTEQNFASPYVYSVHKLGLDTERVNVDGGVIAFGHPLDKSFVSLSFVAP